MEGVSDLGNKEIFARNLNHYMKINNVDRNKLCRDLDFNYTTVREWTNGTSYPRIDKIEMLANYFDIKKSDLIEDKNKYNDINFLEQYKVLFDKDNNLTDTQRKFLIDFLTEQHKKQDNEQ